MVTLSASLSTEKTSYTLFPRPLPSARCIWFTNLTTGSYNHPFFFKFFLGHTTTGIRDNNPTYMVYWHSQS